MLQDLKNACHALLQTPLFTCVVVGTLALGIGANTAIFGVVNKLLLNSLPYPESDRLFYLRVGPAGADLAYSPPSYVASAWREQARLLESIEGFAQRDVLAYDENGARLLHGMGITSGLPALLGVAPLFGRSFTAADAEPGAPAVVVLSYAMWQRDYGGARAVIGRAVTFDEVPRVVIGVMPASWDAFARGFRPDVWFPLSFPTPGAQPVSLEPLGRVRSGVSPTQLPTNSLRFLPARNPKLRSRFPAATL